MVTMTLHQIVADYGYWAIFIGTFLEGETILVIGGFFAHRGYLSLPLVVSLAFLGTFCGDQLFFYLGRARGMDAVNSRPAWKRKSAKVFRLLRTHQTLVIISFRFLYGIRIVTPFILGASGVKPARFFTLNLIGASVWAMTIGLLGYFLGQAMELFLAELKRYEFLILGLVVTIGALIWLAYGWRQRRANRTSV